MVTILHGASDFQRRERLVGLLSQVDPSGLSTTRFPAGTSPETIFAAALSPGLFGEARVIVVEELLVAHLRGSHLDESLVARLQSVPATTHLICLEHELPAPALDQLRRTLGTRLSSIVCAPPRGSELVAWVQQRAARYGVTVEPDAARELVALLDAGGEATSVPRGRENDEASSTIDLARLDAEIAKLALAAYPDQVVSSSLVHRLVAPEEAPLGWALVDAIRRERDDAIVRELTRALEAGTPAEALLGQIAAHFETVLAAHLSPHQPAEVVQAATGIPTNRIGQARRISSRATLAHARQALAALRTIDASLKRGTLSDAEAALTAVLATLYHRTQPPRN
ncbi:MAG: hypothetical protein N2Z82_06500 [Thermomicrobium sp.]|nr:hypothetical protein [Thermomicrobium sp.]